MSNRFRKARVVPFGYMKDPENDKILVPNPHEQEVITQAREYYGQQVSMRNLIAWIQAHTGRKLSLRGLKKVMDRQF